MKRRVVITGIGAITPIGIGVDALWSGIRREVSPVQAIDRFDSTPFRSRIAAQVNNFDPLLYLDTKTVRRHDRFSLFAMASAQMACDDAGLSLQKLSPSRTGVSIGSALGGVGHAENEHVDFVRKGAHAVSRLIALSVFTGAGSSNVSILFGLQGPALSNASSCASGTIAIGEAFRVIQRGEADVMLAGGAEAPLSPLCFGAFDFLGLLSQNNDNPSRACRPFACDRDGMVMGEGAAVFVLESYTSAMKRNAAIYGEITGYGRTSDGHHMTAPLEDGSQASRAISLALKESKISTDDLSYISAHGSGTRLNDSAETRAVKKALSGSAKRVPISSTKPLHGHALGASGALELAISLLGMKNNYLPPTLNLHAPADDCDLDYVPQKGRRLNWRSFISQSFGFGGFNAALAISSCK